MENVDSFNFAATAAQLRMFTNCSFPCETVSYRYFFLFINDYKMSNTFYFVTQLWCELQCFGFYTWLQRNTHENWIFFNIIHYVQVSVNYRTGVHLDWPNMKFHKNRNTMVKDNKEHLLCDNTCLLGEIGGNLGLFLGGSIYMFFDIIMEFLEKKFVTS